MPSQGLLTSYLLSSTPHALTRATTHPFLVSAGRGTIPKPLLSQWLSQDRLYAQSYIRFIGLLLAKIRLPAHNPNSATPRVATSEQHAVDVLIDALVNIRTELRFFDDTAAEYDLDLTAISVEEGGVGLGESGTGSYITTSADISTTGSGSCPGFTGGHAGKGTETGERESGLHGLCGSQGECQMQADGGEVCYPPTQSNSNSITNTQTTQNIQQGQDQSQPANLEPTHGECDPACRTTDTSNPSAEPLERGGPIFFCATRTTRAYIDLFMSAGSAGVSVLEGLAVLWATEVCYLRSWRYASSFLKEREANPSSDDTDGGALRDKFIPNWSSAEFEAFVNGIGDVLDEMAESIKGAEEAEMMRGRCLEWWRQVVWLEERFWPTL
ncbi:hypothetical protein NUU61_003186 [Penicillium alfredii]|uniref:Thiaminase-2/PQQC domain-containing protein n=1 Tax=Penicillium alfredii TaxID=1506179 RepID=A0A9W9KGN2_9EURO|nr:uncharacterized protein NUU61_003186 [Penicillium alfredii]KAJ5105839.1 hypothetical protein NUU61_003186 [Penicillium alfredii]